MKKQHILKLKISNWIFLFFFTLFAIFPSQQIVFAGEKTLNDVYCVFQKPKEEKYLSVKGLIWALKVGEELTKYKTGQQYNGNCKISTKHDLDSMFTDQNNLLRFSGIDFTNILVVDGKKISIRISITSNSTVDDYDIANSLYYLTKENCGFEKFDEDYQLYKINDVKFCSRMFVTTSNQYTTLLSDGTTFTAKCTRYKNCYLNFIYRNWKIIIFGFQEKLLNNWQAIHKAIMADLKKRTVFYYTPEKCEGEFCNYFKNHLNQKEIKTK